MASTTTRRSAASASMSRCRPPTPCSTARRRHVLGRQVVASGRSPATSAFASRGSPQQRRRQRHLFGNGLAPSQPPAVSPSTITLRATSSARLARAGNATISDRRRVPTCVAQPGQWPLPVGPDRRAKICRRHRAGRPHSYGSEAFLNAGPMRRVDVFVMFTSSAAPGGVPQMISAASRRGRLQVLYRVRFQRDCPVESAGDVALQVRACATPGAAWSCSATATVLLATGDNGDNGEDGASTRRTRQTISARFFSDQSSHVGCDAVASGVLNVQRLFVNPNAGDADWNSPTSAAPSRRKS